MQVLFRRRPEWKAFPAAVVASNRPLARVQALNRSAAAAGIHRGMRYATALSLVSELRADVVSEEDLCSALEDISTLLSAFSPVVEQCGFDREVFWLDTHGLLPLFDSLSGWAGTLKDRLSAEGFHANLTIGFSRFGTFAWAKRRKAVRIFSTLEQEQKAAVETPLSVLPFPPRILELTGSLGLRTVGDFTALPAGDIRKRLGSEALEMYRFASTEETLPLQGAPKEEEPVASVAPLVPIKSRDMLEHSIGELLEDLVDEVSRRGESIRELHLTLRFEGGARHTETITPAHASRSPETLARLVHFRLEHLTATNGVTHISIEAQRVEVSFRQEELFVSEQSKRLDTEEKALAYIRAELGNGVISHIRLFDEHLPEERFARIDASLDESTQKGVVGMSLSDRRPRTRESTERGPDTEGAPQRRVTEPRLVRRLRSAPLPIAQPSSRSVSSADGRRGRLQGPHILSGLWWRAQAVHREYYYFEVGEGPTLWIYYDREQGRWFRQGSVD